LNSEEKGSIYFKARKKLNQEYNLHKS